MIKQIKLNYINRLKDSILEKNGLIQVLLGPRQVGKTTSTLALIEEQFQGRAHYVSADKVFNSSAQWIADNWRLALQEQKILFIDEIQKCENWAETIKMLYDESKKKRESFQCVLLGSSSLEIQKGLTESLTGRFQLHQAFHWNFNESKAGYQLSFDDYLKFGGYPGSYPFINKKETWDDYVKNSIINTVIEKDILQYQSVRSPALFRQAFEILMAYPAQEISYTKLLGQIQNKGNVELIKHYLHLYQGAFLVKVLEKFSLKTIKTKSSSPKILPLAPCFYYLTLLDEYQKDEKGRAFELVVGSQLVRIGWPLYYWRDGKHEIDFVLKYGRQIFAVEVKSNRKKPIAGFEAFKKLYPGAKYIVVNFDNYFEFEKDPAKFLKEMAK